MKLRFRMLSFSAHWFDPDFHTLRRFTGVMIGLNGRYIKLGRFTEG